MRKCLMCKQPMKFSKNFKPIKGKQNSYIMRRMNCTFCEYSEMVCADGEGDEMREHQALEAVKQMYKEDEDNQNMIIDLRTF